MRVLLSVAVACAAMISVAACTPAATDEAADAGCADSLAVTGWCPSAVTEAIDAARQTESVALEGPAANCTWATRDVAIGDGSEAIVYRAMTCNGVTTTFEYSGGAHSASLNYATSAMGHEPGAEAVRIFTSDPQNPNAALQTIIDALPAAERAKCEVQPANVPGWPADALVIGYNAEAARGLSADEPHALCGEFGRDDDSVKYWQIRDGYAYFFNLGQDGIDFEPNSLSVFRRSADGVWSPAS